MPFALTDQHLEDYHSLGYTVFRRILPPSLVGDLRRVTDHAREIARTEKGGQTQRLQPVAKYDLDQQPFVDYAELPELVDAIAKVLTPRHRHGDRDIFGVLLEPQDLPWCTIWHRDWRDNIRGLPLEMWDAVFSDINYFNQINCALYADDSTWVVPGSHLRRDLPREIERFPDRPISGPDLDGAIPEERESICLDYCYSMPGGVQLRLDAGDFALYRNTLWHIGNYVPYKKRATIHDGAMTPEFTEFFKTMPAIATKRREEGHEMDNPNV
jgi:ectoine hydroxylase-related dioxygenase (phytanoyl-CoA dioxygenase family)